MARKQKGKAPPNAPDPNDPAFIAATQWMIGGSAEVAQLADMCRGHLEREIETQSTSFIPALLVLTRTGPDAPPTLQYNVLALNFNTAAEQRAVLTSLGQRDHAERRVPVAAALMAEAWMNTQARGAAFIEPRLDPARKECLIAHVASVGAWSDPGPGLARLIRLPVKRGPGNVFVQDGDIYDTAGDAARPIIGSPHLHTYFLAYCTAAGRALDAWRHRN